jgi:hypothetical protein
LLAAFLSPCKSPETRQALKQRIESGEINWGEMLYQADQQFSTPLWRMHLEQDGLLPLLPEDFQQYLTEFTALNRDRNEELQAGLHELLAEFIPLGIEPLLIKGAASIAQGLYADPGARILSDLDMLVPPERAGECEDILRRLGYTEIPDPDREPDHLATDARHHHISPYYREGTSLLVEIHTNTAYAISGQVLPGEEAWRNSTPLQLGAHRVHILSPTHQVLLNTLHALLPHREFISGRIELRQLTEFAHLVLRHGDQIDWNHFHATARCHGLATEFSTYLILANHLLELPSPPGTLIGTAARFHTARILAQGQLTGVRNPDSRQKRLAKAHRFYYYLGLPDWTWTHPCHAVGIENLPARLSMLVRKIFNVRAWRKI